MRAALVCLIVCLIGMTFASEITDLEASIAQHNANLATLNGIKQDVKNIDDTIKCFVALWPEHKDKFTTVNAAIAAFNAYLLVNVGVETSQLVIDNVKLQALTIQTNLSTAVSNIGGALGNLFGGLLAGLGKRSVKATPAACKNAAVLMRATQMYEVAVLSAVQDARIIAPISQAFCTFVNGLSNNAALTTTCGILGSLFPSTATGKRDLENEKLVQTILSLIPQIPSFLQSAQQGNFGQIINAIIAHVSNSALPRNSEAEKILTGIAQSLISSAINGQLTHQSALNTILQALGSLGGVGKRSAEEQRIIATITSTLSNLWAGLHPTIMPHVDNLLAEMLSHVGNAGQSLLGAISGISGAVGGKRSAEDQKIIDALAGVLGGHLSEILNHGQLIAANIASTFLQNLLASLPGKRSVEEERLIANVMGAISSAQAGNWAQVATHVGNIFNIVGKRSVEEQRIIATITSTLSNLWAGLHPTIMPHVDNLLAEMLSHVGNAGASLLGAISGISGAVGGY